MLKDRAAAARFIGLYTGDPTPEAGEAACAECVAALPRPLDAVVLGMGEDGHSASWFPGAKALPAVLQGGERPCRAIRAPGVVQPRMTFTLPALLDARQIILTFQGMAKRHVYESALQPGEVEDLPVRAVLRQERTSVEVWWSP